MIVSQTTYVGGHFDHAGHKRERKCDPNPQKQLCGLNYLRGVAAKAGPWGKNVVKEKKRITSYW